jgi:hypothetical protein
LCSRLPSSSSASSPIATFSNQVRSCGDMRASSAASTRRAGLQPLLRSQAMSPPSGAEWLAAMLATPLLYFSSANYAWCSPAYLRSPSIERRSPNACLYHRLFRKIYWRPKWVVAKFSRTVTILGDLAYGLPRNVSFPVSIFSTEVTAHAIEFFCG